MNINCIHTKQFENLILSNKLTRNWIKMIIDRYLLLHVNSTTNTISKNWAETVIVYVSAQFCLHITSDWTMNYS